MTKSEILDWFSVNNASLDANRILFVLGMGMMLGVVIFATYRITYAGVSYNAKFNVGNVVMLLIAAVIMLMISSNIAISLGMVGALSIVRFRTAIKDPQDTIYIFWSIVEGLCAGAPMFKLAFLSTLVIAVLIVSASMYYHAGKKYLIIIRGGQNLCTEEILQIVGSRYKKAVLKAANYSVGHSEMIVEVAAKGALDSSVIDTLRQTQDVVSVNWLLEMGEHIG